MFESKKWNQHTCKRTKIRINVRSKEQKLELRSFSSAILIGSHIIYASLEQADITLRA
jgi:hypothetical protein